MIPQLVDNPYATMIASANYSYSVQADWIVSLDVDPHTSKSRMRFDYGGATITTVSLSVLSGTGLQLLTPLSILVGIDDCGDYYVREPVTSTMGVGRTVPDAVADFSGALRMYYHMLEDGKEILVEALSKQREYLRGHFISSET